MSVSASNTASFLIPRNRVLPGKLMVCELLEIFPAFHGTRRFITMFTRARYLSLSWTTLMQSTPSHPFHLRSVLRNSFHRRLGLRIGLFMFLHHISVGILHACHMPHPSHPPLIWSHEWGLEIWRCSLCDFLAGKTTRCQGPEDVVWKPLAVKREALGCVWLSGLHVVKLALCLFGRRYEAGRTWGGGEWSMWFLRHPVFVKDVSSSFLLFFLSLSSWYLCAARV